MRTTGSRVIARTLAWLLLMLALTSSVRLAKAEDRVGAGLRRWAVIPAADVRASPVCDLLSAMLSSEPGVELVERQQLDAVINEIKLESLLGDDSVAARLKMGQFLKADALLLITRENDRENPGFRTTICDTRTGTRLLRDVVPSKDEVSAAEKLKSIVSQIRKQFPNGPEFIVAVTPFVAESLTHEHDRLQTSLARLLETGLSAQPGVATVELEEARAIGRETQIAGGQVRRVVPCFVEGRYRVNATPDGPRVDLSAEARSGDAVLRKIDRKAITIDEATKVAGTELPAEIIKTRGGADFKPMSLAEQVVALVARADAFARLGQYRLAIDLREAALLLDDSDSAIRYRLLLDSARYLNTAPPRLQIDDNYVRTINHVDAKQEREARQTDQKPTYGRTMTKEETVQHEQHNRDMAAEIALRRTLWAECLTHAHVLISRNAINRLEASHVMGGLIRNSSVQFAHLIIKEPEVQLRRKFMSESWPNALSLPLVQKQRPSNEEENANAMWFEILLDGLGIRSDGERATTELPMLSDLLENAIPENFVMLAPLNNATTSMRCSRKEREEFLAKLANSKRLYYELIGKCWQLHFDLVNLRQSRQIPSEEFDQRLKELRVLYGRLPRSEAMSDRSIKDSLTESIKRNAEFLASVRREMFRPVTTQPILSRPTTVPSTAPLTITPKNIRSGRVLLEPIPLSILDSLTGALTDANAREEPLHLRDIIACGDQLELWHTAETIYAMRKPGVLEPWLTMNVSPGMRSLGPVKDRFTDVKWDGKRAWVGTFANGLKVLDDTGKIITTVGPAQGLPPYESALRLWPLAPDRIVAIGAFGNPLRSWGALIESDGQGGYKARTIFEAIAQLPPMKGLSRIRRSDMAVAFTPYRVIPLQTPGGRRAICFYDRMLDLQDFTLHPVPVDNPIGPMGTEWQHNDVLHWGNASSFPRLRLLEDMTFQTLPPLPWPAGLNQGFNGSFDTGDKVIWMGKSWYAAERDGSNVQPISGPAAGVMESFELEAKSRRNTIARSIHYGPVLFPTPVYSGSGEGCFRLTIDPAPIPSAPPGRSR